MSVSQKGRRTEACDVVVVFFLFFLFTSELENLPSLKRDYWICQ